MPKIKEFTPTQSMKLVQSMFKNKVKLKQENFKPGTILFYNYNAKDKTQTYDRTPLVLILKRNRTHTMAINLHWAPTPLRVVLVKKIIQVNKKNIQLNKPLEFDYNQLRPFLKKVGFAPIIRLYINKRISNKGVIIPSSEMMTAARLKTETFTNGRVSAEELYRKALNNNKKYRKTRKRRQ